MPASVVVGATAAKVDALEGVVGVWGSMEDDKAPEALRGEDTMDTWARDPVVGDNMPAPPVASSGEGKTTVVAPDAEEVEMEMVDPVLLAPRPTPAVGLLRDEGDTSVN